ncbi:hypothetical protein T472_0214785 [Youngiibacter fragilis 232.1]|uniref:Uncharacterized protein n=1 Tax=Youngiibacter fragilis 232.1 TaxID=994573 RepID=V7I473_9CLOT|nr:hypothetical protein T472_0214785 [Youngiibacter fragilis 232.1]
MFQAAFFCSLKFGIIDDYLRVNDIMNRYARMLAVKNKNRK